MDNLLLKNYLVSHFLPHRQDVTRTCVCEGVSKLWLRDHVYHFQLVPSDNVVLLAFHVQLQGDSEEAQVRLATEARSSQGNVLSRAIKE